MKALHIHVGARARRHIAERGLRPDDIRLVPAAAGGPKGLMLTHLDQHLFGDWLPQSTSDVHLVGASIGAWRMATAALPDPRTGFAQLAQGYIHQHIEPEPGRRFPSAARITAGFQETLQSFFGTSVPELLNHPRFRLHVLTSRGRTLLHPGTRGRTMLGFTGLALSNALSRRSVGFFMERTVFSSGQACLPLELADLPTRQVPLTADNFLPAMLASCSIPFMLEAVRDIPGAPAGCHWDGGIVDYHLHWPYASMNDGLVLYPHFQRQVVPGWLDKTLRWRHRATPGLDNLIVLAPNPEWVRTLPGAKLPDRHDFKALGTPQRIERWTEAVARSEELAREWREWLDRGCPADALLPL